MVDWKKIEEDAVAGVRDLIGRAAADAPVAEEVSAAALEGAGVPAPIVEAARMLLNGLLSHWTAEHTAAPPAAPAPAAVEPADPNANPAEEAEAPRQNYV